jgi:hypothetical protein
MTFDPASFISLAGLRDGEIASFSGTPRPVARLFEFGQWRVPSVGRDARFRMCLDRLRLQGFDRAVARGGGGALAWKAIDPSRAQGAISLPLPLSPKAGQMAWEAMEAGPDALEMTPGEYRDMPLTRSAHARLRGAFLLGPGWERVIAAWAGREDLLLRVWRWEGAIAVGARMGTAGWAPTLAMPLPAAV